MKEKTIGVLMGGLSSEREVSLNSGKAVLQSLLKGGYRAVAIDADRDLPGKLVSEKIDLAFVVLHGKWGEDGTVQGLLELMSIPYTGSGVLGSALAMDKCLGKPALMGLKISTPPYRICKGKEECDLPLPFVVKPAREGSSVGISIVRTKEEIQPALDLAFTYDTKVLVEQFVKGREITVGVVNGAALPIQARLLPPACVHPLTQRLGVCFEGDAVIRARAPCGRNAGLCQGDCRWR